MHFVFRPLAAAFLVICLGCSKSELQPDQVVGPALYGQIAAKPSPKAERLRPPQTNRVSAASYVLQTELSPATLVFSTNKYVSLFTGLGQYGLGAPSHLAFTTRGGPRAFTNGARLVADEMDEAWLLVWFSGAKGWTNWDSPWAVFLQRKPASMKLDENGLHLGFRGGAEHIVMMPLYGYYKPPVQGTTNAWPVKKLTTWKWSQVLPTDVLMRVRYWASAAREFPIYCEDSFSVDPAKESVTFRQRFQWVSTRDDWNTRPIKVAPISPPLAQAASDETFPAKFSGKVVDLDLPTPYGPSRGIEGMDEYEVSLRVLKYVHQTEIIESYPTNASPLVTGALEQLRQAATAAGNAKALPFLDATTRSNAVAAWRTHFREVALRDDVLEPLWAYGHFSGDWELIRERWDAIKKAFRTPAEIRWVGFGRDTTMALANKAPLCLAMARMAYRVGDLETYYYACSVFARELVHHWVQQRGGEYFRKHQPWHSMKPMGAQVYPTSLLGENAGWQIGGPESSKGRWQGFQNEDVARFYREYLQPDVRREFDLIKERNESVSPWLRSLLLGETPDEVEPPTGSSADTVASCLAVIRGSHPIRYQLLIPPAPASPFMVGIERDVAGPNPYLVTGVEVDPWPRFTWSHYWKTPNGSPWTFGQVVVGAGKESPRTRIIPLNWNTRAIVLD